MLPIEAASYSFWFGGADASDTPPYMAQTLFPLLVNAPAKRLVMYGEGTHSIIMEKNRMQLFNAVQDFLEEKLEANRS
jgi:alpha-beta hydrolase superfamily lysophospholipase